MTSTDSVLDRVRRAVLAGVSVDSAIAGAVRDASEESLGLRVGSDVTEADVSERMAGFGRLQPLLDDSSIEEIWVNDTESVFVARAGHHEQLPIEIPAEELRTLVERLLRRSGRRVDVSQPFVDASLPDGSRLHVVIPPITRNAWSLNIRKFSATVRTLDDLVRAESFPVEVSLLLRESMEVGHTVLVSGATQAGKTTLTCALLASLPAHERIITVEETFEIAIAHRDTVALQCRGASLDGVGEVTLRRLVKEALRMRPTRLVVGEVRGDEALDLLVALNSGIPGLCTIHANSAGDAVRKLITLCQLAGGVSESFVATTVAATVDRVVHCRMGEDGVRRVMEIARPVQSRDDASMSMETLWTRS